MLASDRSGSVAQWLVRQTVERLSGGDAGSIPTVSLCQLTTDFQHKYDGVIT